jgi:cell fate regulator YaaT (PSP1 superfamily)
MPILPLPVFEADADPRHRTARSDREIYEALEPPKSIVVRFGAMRLVGEYAYDGDAKPGCGTRLVVRTHRGTELAEMLTTTCENAGCSKSVTRQEMLDYIENSGGKDYPFHRGGKVLRVATIEDLNKQAALDSDKPRYVRLCKELIRELNLNMKLVDVERILGGELITFFYMSEKRVDFRELVRRLAAEFKTRIDMRQVGARDEARLVADYERCGQHCCCKSFLKVLKPISMKAAKLQKATLDPLKISGRCGRLMCCLRYEDQTYRDLKKNLPAKGTRVGTSDGPGVVIDGRVLVQLVLVRLDHDQTEIAVPIEELMDPEQCPRPGTRPAVEPDGLRGLSAQEVRDRAAGKGRRIEGGEEDSTQRKRRRRGRRSKGERQDAFRERAEQIERGGGEVLGNGEGEGARPGAAERRPHREQQGGPESAADHASERRPKRRRRRRRRGGGDGSSPASGPGSEAPGGPPEG